MLPSTDDLCPTPAEAAAFFARFSKKPGQTSKDCWCFDFEPFVPKNAQRGGYGRFKGTNAPSFSWVLHFGLIPFGLEVGHHCDVRNCVRPDHLYLTTHRKNHEDAANRHRKKSVGAPRMLTVAIVVQMRRAVRAGEGRSAQARKWGVTDSCAFKAICGTTWVEANEIEPPLPKLMPSAEFRRKRFVAAA